ncbi:putative oxidoreductase [Kineosporia sp. NBRC 101677]|nr:putative oxidoreductase [Kineosporia sp. NBRC 101677]
MDVSVGWGFVGTGGIAKAVSAALEQAEGGHLAAVASRDLTRAQEFAQARGVSAAYGGPDAVEQLLADPGVDVVYIANTHPQHYAPARAALLAGKPVLVEKPMTVSLAATQDLFDLAEKQSVFLMEAYWTRFLPGTRALLEQIENGAIGPVQSVHADLGFTVPEDASRFHDPEIGGGSLLDLGPYPVGLAVTLFGSATAVRAVGSLTESGVDRHIALAVSFEGGQVAALSTTMVARSASKAWIEGSKGLIEIAEPVHSVPSFTVLTGEEPTVHEHPVEHGWKYMLEHVHECLGAGLTASPLIGRKWSIDVATIFEEALTQVGVTRNLETLPDQG